MWWVGGWLVVVVCVYVCVCACVCVVVVCVCVGGWGGDFVAGLPVAAAYGQPVASARCARGRPSSLVAPMYSLPAPLKGILVEMIDTNTPTCVQARTHGSAVARGAVPCAAAEPWAPCGRRKSLAKYLVCGLVDLVRPPGDALERRAGDHVGAALHSSIGNMSSACYQFSTQGRGRRAAPCALMEADPQQSMVQHMASQNNAAWRRAAQRAASQGSAAAQRASNSSGMRLANR